MNRGYHVQDSTPSAGGNPRATLPLLISLAVFVSLVPFESLLTEQLPQFTVSKMAGWLFLGVALLNTGFIFFKPSRATLMFAGYLVIYALLGSIGPYGLTHTLFRLSTLIQMLVLFHILTRLLRDARAVTVLLYALWAATTIVAALQLAGVTGTVYGSTDRLSVLGEDPNSAGAVLALGMVCALALLSNGAIRARGWHAAAVIGSIPVVAWALVQTGSRGAVVSLAAGVTVLALVTTSRRGKVKGMLLVVMALGLMLWLTGMSQVATSRWERTIASGDTANRAEITVSAAEMFLERPFFGWGPTSNYDELGWRLGESEPRGTHNQFLGVLTEVGILGALPYAVGVLLCIWGGVNALGRRFDGVPLALLSAVMVVSLSLEWHNRKLYWVALAFAAASRARPTKRTNRLAGPFHTTRGLLIPSGQGSLPLKQSGRP